MKYSTYVKRLGGYGNSRRDTLVNSTINKINASFKDSPSYRLIKINGEEVEVRFIIDKDFSNSKGFIEKKLLLRPYSKIDVGTYVDIDDSVWLVTFFNKEIVYPKSYVLETNHVLKWIDENNNLINKPSTVSAKTLYTTGVRDERVIEIPNGMVGIQLPNDNDTRKIKRGYAFIFNKTKYEVTFYDETSVPGLIILICSEKLEHSPTDDMVNGIANRYIEMPDGTLADRLGEQPPKPNPTEPENPDETPEGITYSYTALMPYPEDPDNEIWWNESATYTIHKFIDGVEVDAEFRFILEQNPSDLVYISNETSNSVTITSYFGRIGEVVLRAIDIETRKVAIEHKINVVN